MSFFSISTSSIDFLLASIGSLFNSVMPIFLIVIGLAVGLWILEFIIGILRKENNTDWDWWETDPTLNEADKIYYRKTRGKKNED